MRNNQLFKVFNSCRGALARSILKMRAHQEDVDDILQETYLRALKATDERQISHLQGYLFTVSRNLVLEKLNHQSREITCEIDDAQLKTEEEAIDRGLHYRRKFEMFNHALLALPERNRQAILLRKFYGLSHKEIAKKMNVSVSSAEKYISGGIKQCKRNLSIRGYEFESCVSKTNKPHKPRSVETSYEGEQK